MYALSVLLICLILGVHVESFSSDGRQVDSNQNDLSPGIKDHREDDGELLRRIQVLESLTLQRAEESYQEVQNLKKENEELRRRLQSLEFELSKTKNKRDLLPAIEFSAKLGHHLGNIHTGQTVVFDSIISNSGSGYNSQTGIFHCDTPGSYAFFINILVHFRKYIEVALVKNGNIIFHALSDGRSGEYYRTGSNMGIVQLQRGDNVWVRVSYHVPGDTDNIIYYDWTTFSGFLIH